MLKCKISKVIISSFLVVVMVIGATACSFNTTTSSSKPITVVWYPNESSDVDRELREEFGRLFTQATGRSVIHKTTSDFSIAIEAIASSSADIAIQMGATGYIEAKNKNPSIDVLFVNADKNGSLDGAKYFGWIAVNKADAEQYKNRDGSYSLENIKGKKISFVSLNSTSAFAVPKTAIREYFKNDNLDDDQFVDGGSDMLFNKVLFPGSHVGSAVNLFTGNSDISCFANIEITHHSELIEGEENIVGTVYRIKVGAEAPFDVYAGKEFVLISCTPVFNCPNVYNPKNLSAAEIKAIQDIFTSDEVANNQKIFYDDKVKGARGMYKKSSSYGYVLTTDSWYDPYR